MIIAINGKIGVGKDTVGKIIQYLTLGEEFSKTNADILADLAYNGYCANKSKFEIKKFAGKLKTIGSLLTGIPVEMFEDQEFKKQYMPEQWDYLMTTSSYGGKPEISAIGSFVSAHTTREQMTYREFLQKLGTEAMREGLHTNVWVNALFADYKAQPNKEVAEFLAAEGLPLSMNGKMDDPKWIITDMRFPNEMEAVVEKGGITIRVVREFYEFSNDQHEWRDREDREGNVFIANPDIYSKEESNKEWRNALKERAHASETSLDEHTMHYEIINDGTIEDLVEKVREILIKEEII